MTSKQKCTLILFILTLLLTTSVWFFVHNRTEQSVQNATPHNTPQQEIAQHIPSKKTPSAQTAQQNNTTAPAQQVTTDTSQSASAGSEIDTSTWQEYCNKEYGFCVRYPRGWEVVRYRASDKLPDMFSPISCEHTPQKCPFTLISFQKNAKNAHNDMMLSFINLHSVTIHDKRFADYSDGWRFMPDDGIVRGCSIMYVKTLDMTDDKVKVILHTFIDGVNDIQCNKQSVALLEAVAQSIRTAP